MNKNKKLINITITQSNKKMKPTKITPVISENKIEINGIKDVSDLPDRITCDGYGICIDCCKGEMIRASKTCEKKTCWTGCTKIATILVVKFEKHKWYVCIHCANRGLCTPDNGLNCLGKRYDLATNQELSYPYPYTSDTGRTLFDKLKERKKGKKKLVEMRERRKKGKQKLVEMKRKAKIEKARRNTPEYLEAKRLRDEDYEARDKERKEEILKLQQRVVAEWNEWEQSDKRKTFLNSKTSVN